jgi:inorganic pyrophosphatase
VHKELEDLPQHLRDEIFHFFTVYKDLDSERHSEPIGWSGREAALAAISEAQARFRSGTQ